MFHRILDMPLVRQVLLVGAIQEAARWDAEGISLGMVGYPGFLYRGKQELFI